MLYLMTCYMYSRCYINVIFNDLLNVYMCSRCYINVIFNVMLKMSIIWVPISTGLLRWKSNLSSTAAEVFKRRQGERINYRKLIYRKGMYAFMPPQLKKGHVVLPDSSVNRIVCFCIHTTYSLPVLSD